MTDSSEAIDVIAVALIRLQRLRERTAAQIRTKDGVDPAAYTVLFRLLQEGPMRAGALAEAVHSDASTVSRQIAVLAERDLVRREPDPDDRRATVLTVTDAGRELAERIRRRRHENLTTVMSTWAAPDQELFAGLLERFVDDYERERPNMVSVLRADTALGPDRRDGRR